MARRPLIFAHRGASAVCPENTLVAFETAIRLAADGVELDVQLTRDVIPVVYHHKVLRKLGGKGPVGAHGFADLRRLDAGGWFDRSFEDERLLALEQALRRIAPRAELLIEIKPYAEPPERLSLLAHAVATAALAYAPRRVRIMCFEQAVLRGVQHSAPELRRIQATTKRPKGRELRRLLAGVAGLCLPARAVDPELAKAVHGYDAELWAYGCDTRRNLVRALRSDVDGVVTKRPDWARGEIARLERV
jgi:glycerophosphoryl diester phosphodiesterase